MAGLPDSAVQVSVATRDERRRALAMALGTGGVPASSALIDRALAESQERDAEWPGLLVARVVRAEMPAKSNSMNGNESPIVGAIWLRFLAGKVGSFSTPQVTADAPAGTGLLLLERGVEIAAKSEVALLQGLVDPNAPENAQDFSAAGFVHTTDLLFLVAQCDGSQIDWRGETTRQQAVQWLPYTAEQHHRLATLVERTYIGSQDCPELDGVRAIDDVLAGYRATGEFDAQRWLIAVDGGRDVGCLLLADHPADDQWELVYLGVDPEFRRHGLGEVLTHRALSMTSQAGRARLVLAVDAANAPALAVYRKAGFETWDRRSIYLRYSDKPREM